MKNNQKGFGTIEALIIFIVIALICCIGWYVLSKNEDDKSIQNTQATSSSDSTSTQTSSEEYLNIPELGVKLKTKHANKLSYVFNSQNNTLPRSDNQESDAWIKFSFKPEFVEDDNCSPGLELYRLISGANPNGDFFKKVGSRYYVFDGGPGPCSVDENAPDDVLKDEVLMEFKASNLEAL